jgi:hypothetical protein
MYNSRLRRKVQVVMRGINEVEITAARTQQWAGMDAPEYGPPIAKTFKGTFENDDGSKRDVEVRVEFPEWCKLTVYRLVGNKERPFTEQLWWIECYGRAGFRSEVPNERWTKAPRQMLHKCVKAAVLRAAFPEEASGFVKEEMEDREIESGGIVIDGKAEAPPTEPSAQDRQADAAYPPADQDEPPAGLAGLDEHNGTQWFKNLTALLKGARSEDEVVAIAGHPRVQVAKEKAATTIRAQIIDMLREARERVRPAIEEKDWTIPHDDAPPGEEPPHQSDDWPDDPIKELLAEIEEKDLIELTGLPTDAQWRVKLRDLFPPDQDRIAEAIATRTAVLKSKQQGDIKR